MLTLREPLGVVVAITPWNFPLIAPIRKIGPALAYGCTMVLKPASYTPWSSVKLMTIFQAAGLPDGVLNLVMGSGRQVGEPLINDDRTKGITFTGSTATGANIAAAAGRRFTRTQLEMGGKNPAVVLGYTDVAAVASQITSAAFACSGQRCTAISRVIVLNALHDELVHALVDAMAAINVGPAWVPGTTMGPLINEEQLNSVCLKLKNGLAEGGRVISGGEILDTGEFVHGHFLQPTLVDEVSPDSLYF
ncbi:Aldehyde dehydrogenase (NAD+) OS=Castellaniella defragrans OX=75697 GN=HNR28_003424 PE=3 SV=1 [Castellaniella defragrans]